MSGKPFYAFLFCILILSLGTSYGDTNVLTNPGFEDYTTGWSGRGCSITTVTSPVHSGSRSGQAYNRKQTWQGIKQDMMGKMLPGETYDISAWVRISDTTSQTVIVSFEQQDGSGTHYYNIDSATANSSSWVQLSGEFTPNVTGTLTVLDVYFEGPPSGVDIYVDDASVVLISSGGWEAEANQRIEQIRKGDFRITAVVPNDPNLTIPDVNVQVIQTRHRFGFGAALAWWPLDPSGGDADYQDFVRDHFEWAVCENDMKWGEVEGTRDVENYHDADIIADWCADNDIILRGHCILWEQNNDQMPSWVPGLDCDTYPNPSEMLDEIDERINSIVNRYKGQIVSWDVDNEMLTDSTFGCLGEAGRAHFFQLANQIDPNCGMYMNEYRGNSFGGYDGDEYVARANGLIALGAPVEGLGIQAHINSPFQPENYYNNVLQELAVLGLPIIATEFDTDASTETQRADDLENFYRICFSHANVEGIIMWGFNESAWRWDGIVNSSTWILNEAGVRYEALMDEWTTNDSEITDSNGNADFRGFYGTYTVTLTPLGVEPTVVTIDVTPDDPNEFTIELAGLPAPTDCQQVQDFGLKLPADLDGNCRIDYTDLLVLADQWLSIDPVAIPPYYSPDIHSDGQVNMLDLSRLADFWLQSNDPEDPNCTPNW